MAPRANQPTTPWLCNTVERMARALEVSPSGVKIETFQEIDSEIIKLIACKSSVKAGDKMSDNEIKGMLAMLGECDVPHRCPHGRPVIIRITEAELDSKFLR